MNMNFNLSKNATSNNTKSTLAEATKEKVVPVEEDDDDNALDYQMADDDYETSTPSSSSNKSGRDEQRKKMIKFMGIFMVVVIVIILIILLCSALIKKSYTYEQIETVLQTAAENYFDDNKEQLPQAEDQIVEIDVANLVAGEYMKELVEYTGEDRTCTSATVQVEKVGNDYLYTPMLSCGTDYQTKLLYQEITQEKNIVTTGYGLYSQNGIYAYRGETVNNYVKMDNSLWRIVKITADNNIVLIKEDKIIEQVAWDDRYNVNLGYTSGINNYDTSRIRENLKTIYKGNEDLEILSSNDKKKLVSYNVCVGKRDAAAEGSDNTIECSAVIQNEKIGLLTIADYINASIDPSCKTASSESCQNYNYLNNYSKWWTGTANPAKTNETYQIDSSGLIKSINTCTYAELRPVVTLNNKALFKSGKGTEKKPYVLK